MSDSSAQNKLTTIEEGTELQGSLASKGGVLVNGTIRGDVSVPVLTVTENGQVIGKVQAGVLRSAGVVEGAMTADEMYVCGTVRDKTVIQAKTLEVNPERRTDPDFVVFGDCVLNVGEEPALRVGSGERAAAEVVPRGAGVQASGADEAAPEPRPVAADAAP